MVIRAFFSLACLRGVFNGLYAEIFFRENYGGGVGNYFGD